MLLSDAPAEEIERQPAPLVLELGLVPQRRSAKGLAEIVRLDEHGVRADASDRPHREHDPATLIQERAQETRVVGGMRVPVSVERAEARRRQRLVHRRVAVDPGVPLGDGSRVRREPLGEARIEQARRSRAAAVVDEPDDRPDAELAKPPEALVGEPPPRLRQSARSHRFPQDGVAEGGDPEGRKPFEVFGSSVVPAQLELVEVVLADSVDRALHPRPHLEGAAAAASSSEGFRASRFLASSLPHYPASPAT